MSGGRNVSPGTARARDSPAAGKRSTWGCSRRRYQCTPVAKTFSLSSADGFGRVSSCWGQPLFSREKAVWSKNVLDESGAFLVDLGQGLLEPPIVLPHVTTETAPVCGVVTSSRRGSLLKSVGIVVLHGSVRLFFFYKNAPIVRAAFDTVER